MPNIPCLLLSNCVDATADAAKVLGLMGHSGNHRLLVTDRGRLVGILRLADLVQFLALHLELEPRR